MPDPTPQPADTETSIQITETDAPMPRQWLSGSLKYEDFTPLTEGGTAQLQTCFDKNLHRTVVYKTLHAHLQSSELETARFLREARVTAMIPHPGTVPVYELGRDRSGTLFFTMKKLEGQDLRTILMAISARDQQAAETFPQDRLVDVLIQACQTVSYAHAQGVIHRDLKPANILVGEFGEVTVLDWGLAKVLRSGGTSDEKRLARRQKSDISVVETVRSGSNPLAADSVTGSVMGESISVNSITCFFGMAASLVVFMSV